MTQLNLAAVECRLITVYDIKLAFLLTAMQEGKDGAPRRGTSPAHITGSVFSTSLCALDLEQRASETVVPSAFMAAGSEG